MLILLGLLYLFVMAGSYLLISRSNGPWVAVIGAFVWPLLAAVMLVGAALAVLVCMLLYSVYMGLRVDGPIINKKMDR